MSESRDRLVRRDQMSPGSHWRRSVRGRSMWVESDFNNQTHSRFGNDTIGRNLFGSPLQTRRPGAGFVAIPADGYRGGVGMGSHRGRGRGVGLFGSGSPFIGVENQQLRGIGRGRGRAVRNSVLPSWYPRRPLGDITAVMNAIERRRIQNETACLPLQQELQIFTDADVSSPLVHHRSSLATPTAGNMTRSKLAGPIQKVLNHYQGEGEELTPQKKLLNSIDLVQKAVLKEFRKMERTPKAKRAERNRKVRILMSMSILTSIAEGLRLDQTSSPQHVGKDEDDTMRNTPIGC
ncbi:hypothetical protein GIB67_040198 [Kingdonia uniflora]|uniref:Uncharacterized protein n=1 Tax=Kingdonia uniflora TaxID=39325 RepID=A0A7J7MV17_9MAGN|nr:hypothetical protein GIB67_040198 [Kingdonia uniflora]